jgi:protoheme IX farnesyltransferase|tara:strand:+ start:266 stop:1192 length:927 start_codon:yes stop_codon:yes gene_type:complete
MTILTENLIRNIRSSYFGKAPDFLALAKPRVMSLAIFTAIVGMMIAPSSIDATRAIFATIAIAVGAGSAGALNMWYDAGTDSMMSRTANRPIPSGRLSSREALLFGLICATVSIILLAISTNLIAALLLAITILFYAVIYTMWLKFRTPHNIVIGGAAGALPPLIGCAAVTGSVTIEGCILFMIIFLWTPPHFWALALYKFRDYENANIPMMPIVAGRRSTQRQIFVYSLALGPVGLMPWMVGSASLFYGVFAAIIGFIFIWHSWKVLVFNPNDPAFGNEKKLFVYSIKYLFLIFAALLVDTVIWSLV